MQDNYKELFLSESQEYLGSISKCLVKIEDNPADAASINEIFRGIHTLKGMSATMGYDKLTQLCHQAEDLLDEIRSKKIKLTSEIIDILFAAVDVIEQLLEEIKINKPSVVDISEVSQRLKKSLLAKDEAEPEGIIASPEIADEKPNFNEPETRNVRIAKEKGNLIFKVFITLSRDCVMKEARAFLVITNLRKLGEIVKSIPGVENLKEGKFDFSFTVFLASKEDQKIIRQELLNISEIEDVVAGEDHPLQRYIDSGLAQGMPRQMDQLQGVLAQVQGQPLRKGDIGQP